jgi:hypothetical protein
MRVDPEEPHPFQLPVPSTEVLKQIGEPLIRVQLPGGGENWIYSRSPSDTHYRVRILVVVNGVAIERKHEFYVD